MASFRLVLTAWLAAVHLVWADIRQQQALLQVGNWPQALNSNITPNSSSQVCEWAGVTYNADQSAIIRLSADRRRTPGPLKLLDSWSALNELQGIYLIESSITGTLPSSWSMLHLLEEVHVQSSTINGTLPESWSNLTALDSVMIVGDYYPDFSGSVMTAISGTLPESWSSLTGLSVLFLYGSSITGGLPASWSNLTNLKELGIGGAALGGPLPSSWSALAQLHDLYLMGNSLTGSLPSQWSNLPSLTELHLSSNRLAGSVPSSWSQMPQLRALLLDHNQVTLPVSWDGDWRGLKIMNLTGNHIGGCSDVLTSQLRTDYVIIVEASVWHTCKEDDYLSACAMEQYPNDPLNSAACHAKHYKLTLIVLCCAFMALLSALCIMFLILRMQRHKLKPVTPDSKFYDLLQKAKAGWARALHWKPWGIKTAALLGLAVFWFDKVTDIRLLVAVFGHTWTGYVLLALFLFQYLVTAYTLVLRFGICVVRWKLFVCMVLTIVPTLSVAVFVGLPAVIILDVLLFFADFGISISCVTTRLNLEQYQLFRDASRTVFGTLPTVVLQAITFTMGTTPANNMQLTSQDFITSVVASAAQMLKVVGQVFYVALVSSEAVLWVVWQHLSAACVPATPSNVSKSPLPLSSQMSVVSV